MSIEDGRQTQARRSKIEINSQEAKKSKDPEAARPMPIECMRGKKTNGVTTRQKDYYKKQRNLPPLYALRIMYVLLVLF